MEDTDESLVSCMLIFAEINYDHVEIVEGEKFCPLDTRPRPDYQPYLSPTNLSFLIEFDEVEDFLTELKTQFALNGCKDADLFVS